MKMRLKNNKNEIEIINKREKKEIKKMKKKNI